MTGVIGEPPNNEAFCRGPGEKGESNSKNTRPAALWSEKASLYPAVYAVTIIRDKDHARVCVYGFRLGYYPAALRYCNHLTHAN
jgi:hypothetical protein